VVTEVEILLDVTPSRVVNIYQPFGVPCCLHPLGLANEVECISIMLKLWIRHRNIGDLTSRRDVTSHRI